MPSRIIVKVGCCAGFSDAASRRLSCARCLPASEKRQGTKSRGRRAGGSGGPMGNRWCRDGRLGVRSGRDRRRSLCHAPVLIAHSGVASVGFVVAASGWRCGPDTRAQLIRAAAASRIDPGVQEVLRSGHELSMASGTGRCCGGPPGPNAATMTRRPPQQGHGSARTRGPSAVSVPSVSDVGARAASSSRMRAMLAARWPFPRKP